jgi:hypothetical protein
MQLFSLRQSPWKGMFSMGVKHPPGSARCHQDMNPHRGALEFFWGIAGTPYFSGT